jgi:hypothetical protein
MGETGLTNGAATSAVPTQQLAQALHLPLSGAWM